jgi:hypothetical protein
MGTFPQTAPKVDLLHGKPGKKDFVVRPSIVATVDYGPDGMACAIRIFPHSSVVKANVIDGSSMSVETAREIEDEVVPPDARGKALHAQGGFQSSACGVGEEQEFENVSILKGESACSKPIRVQSITIDFNRAACSSYPKSFEIRER